MKARAKPAPGNSLHFVTLSAGGNDAVPVRAIRSNNRAVPYITRDKQLSHVGLFADFKLIQ